jgi:RNA polymerase sigma factor (sigma-70 family)
MLPSPREPDEASSERLLVDAKLVAGLAASGYPRSEMDRLKARLAEHGVRVMPGLIYTRRIYTRARQRNHEIRLRPPEPPLTWEGCEDIACFAVAKAIPRFESEAIRGGGWSPEGGATLATHFINMCIDAFPNELRSWQRAMNRGPTCVAVSPEDMELFAIVDPFLTEDDTPSQDSSTDPRLERLLASLSDLHRRIIELKLDDHSNTEIAQRLGISPGAVASAYCRAKARLRELSKEDRS